MDDILDENMAYILYLLTYLLTCVKNLNQILDCSSAQIHITRQDTQHDCLHRLLDVGDKGIEIVYGEEKNI
jgi:hypothetical protein